MMIRLSATSRRVSFFENFKKLFPVVIVRLPLENFFRVLVSSNLRDLGAHSFQLCFNINGFCDAYQTLQKQLLQEQPFHSKSYMV